MKVATVKVLIFGVTGNCGKHCAQFFLNKGWSVFGVGRSKKPAYLEDLTYTKGNICDSSLYEKLPKKLDLVINFAGVQPSILPTSEQTNLSKTMASYVNVNILGILKILEFVRRTQTRTYIYSTSHRDYELHWTNNKLLNNNLPTAINYDGDHTMYAITKTSGKMIGDYYGQKFGTRVFNLRLPMIFLIPETPTYLVDGKPEVMGFLKIIRDAVYGKDLEIWGNPSMRRDYVHIDNLISLIELCNQSNLSGGTFNVGTGEGITTEQFVREIGKVFSKKSANINYIYRPEKKTYKSAVYDISEQKKVLGYRPILFKKMVKKLQEEIDKKDCFKKWGWN